MKNLPAIILILVLCSFVYPKENYFAYQTYKIQPDKFIRTYEDGAAFTNNAGEIKTEDFSFPIFSKSINNYAANKINQTLQISELEILKGFETKSIFEIVSYDGGGMYGGKTNLKFRVFDNNSKILSVKLDQSSCGATCTYWVKYYNFNSGNGDLIQLKDLFTPKGFEKFIVFAFKRRVIELKNEIHSKLPPAERSDFENLIGLYKTDDLTDFYVRNNALYIDGENSFHKNQKFSGIKTISKFNLSEFKSDLNDYGKSIFGLNNKAVKNYRSNLLPQLFQGKIGEQNVVLVLNLDYENHIEAEYVYSKYGKGIFLDGKIKDNKLSFTEKISKTTENGMITQVDNGFIEAEFDGQKIIGNWQNHDKTKTFNLSLSRK